MSLPPPSPKQSKVIWAAVAGLSIAILVVLIVACVWGLGHILRILSPVLWPLAVAGILAYLLDPVVGFLRRHKVPRTRAILVVFASVILLLLGLMGSIVPQVVTETRDLAQRLPDYANRLQDRADVWLGKPHPLLRSLFGTQLDLGSTNQPASSTAVQSTNTEPSLISTNAAVEATPETAAGWDRLLGTGAFKSGAGWLARFAPRIGAWIANQVSRVASLFGILIGLALLPIYTFYFLLEKRGIESHWTDYLPVAKSEFKTELVFVITSINDHLISFFRGQVLVAICDGILYTIGFLIIGLPYSALLGVMATILTMIPFLGAILTCATALIIAVAQFGDWQHPLLVVAVFSVVQTLEGFVIQPKILGDRVGLHPLTIMIAVMVGTTVLGGLLGGILAIPLTAAGKVLMLRYVWKKRPTQVA